MKMYLKYITALLLTTLVLFEIIVLGIIAYPGGMFHSTYQSVIQDKYRVLKETNEPKIIVISGSSSAFGLDQAMLEETTGYKVVNLGLHAGFGHLFNTELAKANINEGDIVLLGYEYDWCDGFSQLDQRLIMSGIDDNIEMYTNIPVERWPDFIGYIFKYAQLKNEFGVDATGIYSREAFNSETGQMILERSSGMEYSVEEFGVVDVSEDVITDNTIEYLKKFKQYVEKQGASVFFIAPPVVIDGITCDYAEFDRIKDQEELQIGIPYISNPLEYIFPSELMYDALYHCNSAGEKIRTQLLIGDLKRAKIIE